jgi:hypothetical protein
MRPVSLEPIELRLLVKKIFMKSGGVTKEKIYSTNVFLLITQCYEGAIKVLYFPVL